MTTAFENTLADSSRSRIIITPEANWGEATTTADNAVAKVIPFTGEGLAYTPTTVASATITARRTASDLVLANLQAEGDISAEFSGQNFDPLLKAALLSSGSDVGGPSTWLLINATPGEEAVLTLTGGATFSNLVADTGGEIRFTAQSTAIRAGLGSLIKGQVITVAGVLNANQNLNGTFTVASASSTSSGATVKLVERFVALTTAITETSNDITITTQRIADGNAIDTVNRQSFTVEKQLRLNGTANKYFLYRGMMVNSLTFSVSSQELATISVSFLGKDSIAHENGDPLFSSINTAMNATGLTASNLEAALAGLSNPSVNGSDDFSGVYQDGELQGLVSSFSLTINNNLRAQNALGTLGAVSLGVGTSDITGTLDIFLKDLVMYKKFIANETSSLQFRFQAVNAAGVVETYQIYLPRIKFSNVEQPVSANNTDVITTGTFTALYDEDSNASIVISKA